MQLVSVENIHYKPGRNNIDTDALSRFPEDHNTHTISCNKNVFNLITDGIKTQTDFVKKLDSALPAQVQIYLKKKIKFLTNQNSRFTSNRVKMKGRLLTLSRRRPLSYRNQSIDLRSKSMDCFLYDNGLCHERVKRVKNMILKDKQIFPKDKVSEGKAVQRAIRERKKVDDQQEQQPNKTYGRFRTDSNTTIFKMAHLQRVPSKHGSFETRGIKPSSQRKSALTQHEGLYKVLF